MSTPKLLTNKWINVITKEHDGRAVSLNTYEDFFQKLKIFIDSKSY